MIELAIEPAGNIGGTRDAPKRAISKHIYSTADLTWQKTKGGHWAVRCVGMLRPLLHVVPDAKYPAVMWRIMTPDGELSDMANLMRAKDAALSVALSIIRHWQAGPPSAADARHVRGQARWPRR